MLSLGRSSNEENIGISKWMVTDNRPLGIPAAVKMIAAGYGQAKVFGFKIKLARSSEGVFSQKDIRQETLNP